MKCPAITQYIKPSLNKFKVEKAKPYKLHLKTQKPILQIQNAAAKKKKKKGNRLGNPHSSRVFRLDAIR